MTHILIDNPDWDDGSWGGLERVEFDFKNPKKFNSTQQFYERDDGPNPTWAPKVPQGSSYFSEIIDA